MRHLATDRRRDLPIRQVSPSARVKRDLWRSILSHCCRRSRHFRYTVAISGSTAGRLKLVINVSIGTEFLLPHSQASLSASGYAVRMRGRALPVSDNRITAIWRLKPEWRTTMISQNDKLLNVSIAYKT